MLKNSSDNNYYDIRYTTANYSKKYILVHVSSGVVVKKTSLPFKVQRRPCPPLLFQMGPVYPVSHLIILCVKWI